jgi:hypothetical protein
MACGANHLKNTGLFMVQEIRALPPGSVRRSDHRCADVLDHGRRGGSRPRLLPWDAAPRLGAQHCPCMVCGANLVTSKKQAYFWYRKSEPSPPGRFDVRTTDADVLDPRQVGGQSPKAAPMGCRASFGCLALPVHGLRREALQKKQAYFWYPQKATF